MAGMAGACCELLWAEMLTMLRLNSKHEITFLCGDEMFESWRTGLFNGYSKNIDFSFLRQGKSNRISHPAMLNRDARLSVALLTLSNILQGTTAKPGFPGRK
jgi:hypothetical protein